MTDQPAKVITAGALALLLCACTNQQTSNSAAPTTTQPSFNRETTSSTGSTSAMPTPPAAAPISDPIAAAKQWLISYRSMSWTDPKPSAWVDRIRPTITDRLAGEYDQLRNGSGGADWADFVQRRCTSKVENLNGTRPAENPGTETAATVLVSGQITTTCAAGEPPTPKTNFAATLTVIKSSTSGWLVDRQVY